MCLKPDAKYIIIAFVNKCLNLTAIVIDCSTEFYYF